MMKKFKYGSDGVAKSPKSRELRSWPINFGLMKTLTWDFCEFQSMLSNSDLSSPPENLAKRDRDKGKALVKFEVQSQSMRF